MNIKNMTIDEMDNVIEQIKKEKRVRATKAFDVMRCNVAALIESFMNEYHMYVVCDDGESYYNVIDDINNNWTYTDETPDEPNSWF